MMLFWKEKLLKGCFFIVCIDGDILSNVNQTGFTWLHLYYWLKFKNKYLAQT